MAGPGCGDNKGSNGAGVIGGAGGNTPSGTGGAGCSSIVNRGETITQVQATGTLPEPLGGTILDGTYVLTKDEAYPPVTVSVPFAQQPDAGDRGPAHERRAGLRRSSGPG